MSFIKVTNGTNLFYKDWGTGTPVIFVHGWCINCDSWEYIMHEMCDKGFRCIAYDQRGCGRSDQPWRGFDYSTLADDLATLIEKLDLDNVILVGHSMGCGVITQYLADYGNLHVLKAVLIGTTTPNVAKSVSNPNGVDRVYFDEDINYIKRDRADFVYSLVDDFFDLKNENNIVSPQMVQWAMDITLQASSRAAVEMRSTCYNSNQREDMKEISIPVLLLHGDKDTSCPINLTAAPTHDLLINSRLKIYEGLPHGMYITEAPLISADIMDFINQK
jgi:pimeloyl-ACP methyl ester carboxylesterase